MNRTHLSHRFVCRALGVALLFAPHAHADEPVGQSASGLSDAQLEACRAAELDQEEIASLVARPLYEFTETEVDKYLRFLHAWQPDLRKRIVHLARKNIGQPYELYLLGEMPFEHYDPQPLYCLAKSDCLVYSEHTYAMALGASWPRFMALLQRIRYRDGQIGVVTRNHYTEVDWNTSNRWLVTDRTRELAGDAAVEFRQRIDRAGFFQRRYDLEVDIPVEDHHDVYLPFEEIDRARPHLEEGDFVNIVRGVVQKDAPPNAVFGGSAWVGHVGMIVHGDEGEVHMIHSARPAVREEPIDDYIAASTKDLAERDNEGKPRLLGFKFLRLTDRPLAKLREIDGDDAPRLTLPSGAATQF